MGLKDIYLKIEDKWFDLLDFFDDKGIPVYKAVDPLEKNGIPSLPIFLILILAIGFLTTSTVTNSPSIQLVSITNQNGEPIPATIKLYDANSNLINTITANGTIQLKVKKGDYYADINSSNCMGLTNQLIRISNQEKVFNLTCNNLLLQNESNFCFEPDDIGQVTIQEYYGNRLVSSNNCGYGSCSSNITEGRSYLFKADGYNSNQLTYNELQLYLEDGQCIQMKEETTEPSHPQPVKIKVIDDKQRQIENADVQLVNPEDEEGIKYEALTNENGTALFKVELGDIFKIRILGTNNTLSFLTEKNYTVEEGGLTETVIVNFSVSSNITVKETTELGSTKSTNALVSLISYDDLTKTENQKRTNSEGQVIFGVRKGKKYKISVYKEGFNYTESNLIGGENKIIILNPIKEKEVGSIKVRVSLGNDKLPEPLIGATLSLRNIDGTILSSITAPATNRQGITTFTGVPEGEYCITVHRNSGPESDCNLVNVTGGNETRLDINLEKIKYTLKLMVVNSTGIGIDRVSVTIKDDEGNEISEEEKETFGGEYEGEIEEGTTAYAYLYYNGNGKVYSEEVEIGEVESDINKTITLTPLDNSVQITQIEYFNGTKINSNENLKAGSNIYQAVVSIGVPAYSGDRKWEDVNFEIKEDTGTIKFYKGTPTPFKAQSTETVSSDRIFNISEGYNLNTTYQVIIPFRVNSISNESGNYTIKVKANWVPFSGGGDEKQITYPTGTDTYEERNVSITAKQCEYLKNLNMTACYSLANIVGNKTANYSNPSSGLIYEVGNKTRLKISLINEGDDFKGNLLLRDKDSGMSFIDSGMNVTIKEGESVRKLELEEWEDYNITNNEIKILGKNADENKGINLEYGEELSITGITLKAIHPTSSQLTLNDYNLNGLSFGIVGNEPIRIIFDNSNTYDLSNSITFYVVSNETNEIISPYKYFNGNSKIENLIGGSIGINGTSERNDELSINGNNITINFDNNHKLRQPGLNTIHLEGNYIETTNYSFTVKPCINMNGFSNPSYLTIWRGGRAFGNCTINYGISQTSSSFKNQGSEWGICNESNQWDLNLKSECEATIKEVDVNVTTTEGERVGTINKGDNQISYTYELLGRVTQDKLTPTMNINFTFSKDGIKSNEIISIPLNIMDYTPSNLKTNGYFEPIIVENYSNPNPDCISNYCNLYQLSRFLKNKLNSTSFNNGYGQKLFVKIISSQNTTNQVTLNEFEGLMEQQMGEGSVSLGAPSTGDTYTSSSTPHLFINLTEGIENAFGGAIQPGTYEISIVPNIERNYNEINEFRKLKDSSILPEELTENNIKGLQMVLPYVNQSELPNIAGLGDKFGVKLVTKQEGSEGNTIISNSTLNQSVKDLIKTTYGITEDISFNQDSYNVINADVCNDTQIDQGNLYSICGKFNIYSGGEDYSAIAFRDSLDTNQIYFIGKTTKDVIDLINNVTKSIEQVKENKIAKFVGINNFTICNDKEGDYEPFDVNSCNGAAFNSIILTKPSEDFNVQCLGFDWCDTLNLTDTNANGNLINALKSIKMSQSGASSDEVKLLKTSDEKKADLIIAPTPEKATQETKSSDEYINLTNKFYVPDDIKIPKNGYRIDVTTNGDFYNGKIIVFTPNRTSLNKVIEEGSNFEEVSLNELNTKLKTQIDNLKDDDSLRYISKTFNVTNNFDDNCYLDLSKIGYTIEDNPDYGTTGLKLYFKNNQNFEEEDYWIDFNYNNMPRIWPNETYLITTKKTTNGYVVLAYLMGEKSSNRETAETIDNPQTVITGSFPNGACDKPVQLTMDELAEAIEGNITELRNSNEGKNETKMYVNVTEESCYIDLNYFAESENSQLKIYNDDNAEGIRKGTYLINITNDTTNVDESKDYIIYAKRIGGGEPSETLPRKCSIKPSYAYLNGAYAFYATKEDKARYKLASFKVDSSNYMNKIYINQQDEGDGDLYKIELDGAAFDSDDDGTLDSALFIYANTEGNNSISYFVTDDDGGTHTVNKLANEHNKDMGLLDVNAVAYDGNQDGNLDSVLMVYGNLKGQNNWTASIYNNTGLTKDVWEKGVEEGEMQGMNADIAAFDPDDDGTLDSVFIAYPNTNNSVDEWQYATVGGLESEGSIKKVTGWEAFGDRDIKVVAFDSNNNGNLDSILVVYADDQKNEDDRAWRYKICNKLGASELTCGPDKVLRKEESDDMTGLKLDAVAFDSNDDGTLDSVFVAYASMRTMDSSNKWYGAVINSSGEIVSDNQIGPDLANYRMKYSTIKTVALSTNKNNFLDKILVVYAAPKKSGDNVLEYTLLDSNNQKIVTKTLEDEGDSDLRHLQISVAPYDSNSDGVLDSALILYPHINDVDPNQWKYTSLKLIKDDSGAVSIQTSSSDYIIGKMKGGDGQDAKQRYGKVVTYTR